MKANKTRRGYVLWPLVLMSAVSISSACSSSSDGDTDNTGATGGDDGNGGSSGSGGKSSSKGGSANSKGGSANEGGMPMTAAGSDAGGESSLGGAAGASGAGGVMSGGAGAGGEGGAPDLCVGLNLNCANDNNPCTEDECNPATGECGIPRNETACDDGLYCNGEDMCVEGECTAGTDDPCGGRTCNEAMNSCECTMDEHCPADIPGEWGACEYADATCSEIGEHSRLVTTFTCTEGLCVQGAANEEEACGARETDGTECTSDGLRCNGTESCKAGVCTPAGTNQCPNQPATPYCAESGDLCNECTSGTHCAGTEKCCTVDGDRQCIPKNGSNFCAIVVPTTVLPTTTVIGTAG